MRAPIVICGATGNVGSRIAEVLLDRGEPVRVIARNRVRLGPLASRGAEPYPGNLEDSSFLANVFRGARAVFIMSPMRMDAPDLREYQERIADSLVSALEKARVPGVVTLSSVGAHLSDVKGPIRGLHDLETKIDERLPNADAVHLRPSWFMENYLFDIPAIRALGVDATPVRGDLPIPMVATRDIGDIAARLFLEGIPSGRTVRYLLGPRDLTLAEAAPILGRAIGKPDLKHVQFPEGDARKAMIGLGMSESVADEFLGMYRDFNAGRIRPTQERNAQNSTPTTLEEFAETVFAPAFGKAA